MTTSDNYSCVNTKIKHKKYYDSRDSHLKRSYGISLEEYDKMYFEQDGCCMICGKNENELLEQHNETQKLLFVDHNHKTGKVRGLLCRKCNFMISYVGDNFNLLYRAIAYLKLYK